MPPADSAGDHDSSRALMIAAEAADHVRLGRVQTGIAHFVHALRYWPDSPGILHNLANALLSLGQVEGALEAARRAYEAAPRLDATQSNLLSMLLYSPAHSAEDVASMHRLWGLGLQIAERPPRPKTSRIRVGYLSSCFCRNPEFFFTEPILRSHNRRKFEVFCYGSVAHPDEFTDRIRILADHWRGVYGLDDTQVADLIRSDEISVLVDCSGHFARGRLRALASRPAPVQVSLPTYPATTGLAAIDYRISDGLSDPPGHSEHLYAERLVRLKSASVCYSPWHETPEPGPLPARNEGAVTFGSFNRLDKINGAVIQTWARILDRLPQSRLIVHATFHGHREPPPEQCEPLLRAFQSQGIAPGRITFAGARALRHYFELRNQVDIALDTFPFRGLTTTCDSLWMGVPVLTLSGEGRLARTGAAILSAVRAPEWVAESTDEYVEIAVARARDLDSLATMRQSLRARLRESAMMDAHSYTRALEDAYDSMLSQTM